MTKRTELVILWAACCTAIPLAVGFFVYFGLVLLLFGYVTEGSACIFFACFAVVADTAFIIELHQPRGETECQQR